MNRSLILAGAASFSLGVLLPLAMAPASKSSPLFLAIAALFTVAALIDDGGKYELLGKLLKLARSRRFAVAAVFVELMAVSIAWAHDKMASLGQFAELLAPVACGLVLGLVFPRIARADRVPWWTIAAGVAALVVIVDIMTGLTLRKVTGGRVTEYSYNRTLVTLVLLAWPLAAMALLHRRHLLILALVPILPAVLVGESQAAVLGVIIGLIVLPTAWAFPRLTRNLGLLGVLAVLAAAPFIGSLSKNALGAGFHQTFQSAHSSDRVDIWLSFEAAAQRRWITGNGFGSSLNLQNADVAKEIDPARTTLLGASHPHNAFLQLWVELGFAGACLAAVLFICLFDGVKRADQRLQPFMLTSIAVICGIALVSHGAWQPWWWSAIAASAAGFLTLQFESRRIDKT